MKPIHITLARFAVAIGVLCAAGQSVPAGEAAFKPLFPGDSLQGWKVSDWSNIATPQKVAGTPWQIQDGLLRGLNRRTWLISPTEYGDFTLKLQTRVSKGSNGGIGLRFPLDGDPAYTGMEIQVVDGATYYGGSGRPEQLTGSIYDEIAPTNGVVRAVGQWNAWEITAQGSRVVIVLNGKKVTDVDFSKETKARQEKGPALAKRPLKGHIGFQNLNGTIELRNVVIGPPAPPSDTFTPLFDGKSLAGWVNVNCRPDTWTVRDGVIVCSGTPSGVLRTEGKYDDYVLELEYRHLKQGGNAGLFIHSDPLPAPGVPFTRSIEVQIMDGNGGDVFAIHGATMTPDKPHPQGWMRSLPDEDRTNPAGQWNHYRVESRSGAVTLSVNGQVVTRASACNPRSGHICLESEGSEIHFRNIRIAKLPPAVRPRTR